MEHHKTDIHRLVAARESVCTSKVHLNMQIQIELFFHLISLVSRELSNWSWSCKMTRQVTAEKYNLIIFMTQVKYLFPLQLTEATSHARWCWARTYLANLPSEVSPMPTVATWRGFPFLFAQIENRKCMEHSQELFAFPGWEFAFISTRSMSIFQVA